MMACGLIKATLLVVLCVTFVSQTSAGRGRCDNRNSAPNICNCELFSNTVRTSDGATLVTGTALRGATVTAEEFRPRVVGNRFTSKRNNYLLDCVSLCLNNLRAKLQQPNVAADLTENVVPTDGFLTSVGRDNLCEWLFNPDPVDGAVPAAVAAPGDDPTLYYFLRASRPCKNTDDTWEKMTYIGEVNCECDLYAFGGANVFERCYSAGSDIASAGLTVAFLT